MIKKALVFEPHDDDFVVGMGGTGIQLLKRGWRIKSILMTDGRHGSEKMGPQETKKVRKREKSEETDYLGMKCKRMDIEDGKLKEIYKNEEKRAELIIRLLNITSKYEPNVVFIPSRSEGHPDHRATYKFAKKVLKKISSTPLEAHYIVWEVPFLEGELEEMEAVIKVNVNREYEKKLKAIRIHQSQEKGGRYSKMIDHFNAYCSYLYSAYEEKKEERVEVLGLPVQEAEFRILLEDLDFEDVTKLSHGRSSEKIQVD